jgi:hypothetical protein
MDLKKVYRLGRSDRRRRQTDRLYLAILCCGLIVAPAGSALAYSGGPPDGRTNAPGEGNCTACHSTFPLNSGDGSLSIAGIGATYRPDEVYTLALTLADPEASRWGFELTILDDAGASVGTVSPLDGTTQTSTNGDRDYVKQTSSGSAPGTPDQQTWQFQWVAPTIDTGEVVLYVAGNAANNNGSSSGDHIYATAFAFGEEEIVGVGDVPLAARLLPNYPNPFNPLTTIAFELPSDQAVRLTIYGVDGRRITTLVDGVRPAGLNEVRWDGTDRTGGAVPSGTYLYRLESGSTVTARRMVLVR